jgi:tRNA pseudouridine55 synthase
VLIDKPAGMTSHDVVDQVRRALATRSAGHTGTLDPFATGLLVVLLGRATRLARFVQGRPKTYLATARLGTRTDTDDLTGRVVGGPVDVDPVTETAIRDALATFVGEQQQRPPQFSAKLVAGERSYRKARRGETAELPDSSVTIYRIDLLGYQPPELTFRTVVSAGTYIRALARDLGERLGVGAHLTQLRREAIGSLRVEAATPLEAVIGASVIPAHRVLSDLPSMALDPAALKDVKHGRAVRDSGAAGIRESGEAVALLGDGELVAVARVEDGWLRPTVVLDAN